MGCFYQIPLFGSQGDLLKRRSLSEPEGKEITKNQDPEYDQYTYELTETEVRACMGLHQLESQR